jgi:hypothetical protein
MKTIQENYKLFKKGEVSPFNFKKQIQNTFPGKFTNLNSLSEMIHSLKSNNTINEVKKDIINVNFFEKFKEYVNKGSEHGEEVSDAMNNGSRFYKGFYAEMNSVENQGKSVAEIQKIVAKNLSDDVSYYTKNSAFGIKGIGYETSKETEEVKGNYKSSGMEEYTPKNSNILKERRMTKRKIKENLYESEDIFELCITFKSDFEEAVAELDEGFPIDLELKNKRTLCLKVEDRDDAFMVIKMLDEFLFSKGFEYNYMFDGKRIDLPLHSKDLNEDLDAVEKEDSEEGLDVIPSSGKDFNLLLDILDDLDYYGELITPKKNNGYSPEAYFFFPESNNIDQLELELNEIFIDYGIDVTFEGVSNNDDMNENDEEEEMTSKYIESNFDSLSEFYDVMVDSNKRNTLVNNILGENKINKNKIDKVYKALENISF